MSRACREVNGKKLSIFQIVNFYYPLSSRLNLLSLGVLSKGWTKRDLIFIVFMNKYKKDDSSHIAHHAFCPHSGDMGCGLCLSIL
jgi:hypothetical protein